MNVATLEFRDVLGKCSAPVLMLLLCLMLNLPSTAQQMSHNDKGIRFWNLRDAVIQVGFNAIDDDNSRLKRMLDMSKWSIPIAPTRFTLSKQMYDNYHLDIALGAARLKQPSSELKYVNPLLYVNLDFNTRYYLNLFGSNTPGKSTVSVTSGWKALDNMTIDLYTLVGFGFQYISQNANKSMPTFNFGGGVDWWIKKNILAVNMQSAARFALHLAPPVNSGNLLHYTLGICWKYDENVLANLFAIKPKARYKRKRNA